MGAGEQPAGPLELCNVVQGLSCSSYLLPSAVGSDGDFSATLCWEGKLTNLFVGGQRRNQNLQKSSVLLFY